MNYYERYHDMDDYDYSSGTTCPGCGEPLSEQNDAGTGFCNDCEMRRC